MKNRLLLFVSIVAIFAICLPAYSAGNSHGLKWKMVWLWSMGDKSDAYVVSQAKYLGFNAISARSPKMVEECHKQGVQAVGVLAFGSAPKEYGQVMSDEENEQVQKDKKSVPANYQEGGEPVRKGELFLEDSLWCFDRPETLEYGKKEIDRLISEGYDAIAFDYIGYNNYHACLCSVSQAKEKSYQHSHPKLSPGEAMDRCSRDSLVSFYTKLIKYAKSRKKDVVVTAHIYPYFSPEPMYGNRIPLDYCGETASWFFDPHWSYDKIRDYSKNIVRGESRYHRASIGAPFIGVYTTPGREKDWKGAERVKKELQIIKESGARAVQMAELGNILKDPATASAVREELSK